MTPWDAQAEGEDSIYISAVVAEKGNAVTGILILLYLFKYLDLLREGRPVNRAYALAATAEGEKMLEEHMRSAKLMPAATRKDRENLYMVDLSNIPNLLAYAKSQSRAYKKYSTRLANPSQWKPIFPPASPIGK